MRPHLRIRKTVKWVGAAVAVVPLLAAVAALAMASTGNHSFRSSEDSVKGPPRRQVAIQRVRWLNVGDDYVALGWVARRRDLVPEAETPEEILLERQRLAAEANRRAAVDMEIASALASMQKGKPTLRFITSGGIMAGAPLWQVRTALIVMILLLGLTAWRFARSGHRAWQCACCGYDLRGLPAATPCPECGGK